jgi:hypothetical protein
MQQLAEALEADNASVVIKKKGSKKRGSPSPKRGLLEVGPAFMMGHPMSGQVSPGAGLNRGGAIENDPRFLAGEQYSKKHPDRLNRLIGNITTEEGNSRQRNLRKHANTDMKHDFEKHLSNSSTHAKLSGHKYSA